MPTHEKLHVAGDPTDKSAESLPGMYSGALAGNFGGSLGSPSPDGNVPLGVDPSVGAPTGVSAATGAGAAGTAVITFTAVGGNGVEIIAVPAGTSALGLKADAGVGASPFTITGLKAATSYDFWVRSIAADGRASKNAAKTTATSHA